MQSLHNVHVHNLLSYIERGGQKNKILSYCHCPHTSQNIGLFLVRFFDARSLALFSDVYLSNVIDIEPHLAMGDYYLVYS